MERAEKTNERKVGKGFLKNGGWHGNGQYYRIESEQTDPDGKVIAQLLADFLSGDTDSDEVEYEIRTTKGIRCYTTKSSAMRAWRKIPLT